MNEAIKKELRQLIRELESNAISIAPSDAERLLCQIITPLLEADNYSVTTQKRSSNSGVDFVAEKSVGTTKDTIGIEYKHYRSKAVGVDTIRSILGSSISIGLNRAMIVTNSRFTFSAREAVRHQSPVSVELMDIDALRSWVSRIEETENIDLGVIHELRVGMVSKLIPLIAQNSEYLEGVEWRELEHLLAEVFEGLGFDVTLTSGSKDGGKDIIVSFTAAGKEHTYYIEIKHWRSKQKVGKNAAKEFLNIIINENIDGGLYLSTYGYCSNAIESLTEIERVRLRFGEEEKISALCQTYTKARAGLWTMESEVKEVLFEGTV